jgi:uncharacterized membrane protein
LLRCSVIAYLFLLQAGDSNSKKRHVKTKHHYKNLALLILHVRALGGVSFEIVILLFYIRIVHILATVPLSTILFAFNTETRDGRHNTTSNAVREHTG